MGFFELGQLPQEIETFVFSLKQKDISQVIESPYGFHIFKVSQIRESQKVYFDQVKEEIKNNLLSGKLRTAYEAFLMDLKKNSAITLFTENLPFKYESNEYGGNHEPEK
jgi:parvulin-like peptidyl-prolyl isomerase